MGKIVYDDRFYHEQRQGSAYSASRVVPLIVELLAPRSVLDVGCGVGTWCAAFRESGVEQVWGLDGPWVDPNQSAVGADRFVAFDFGRAPMPFKPVLPADRFDLVVTFEFIEHIEPGRAVELVRFLTSLSDVVVAGAAVPGQGGTHHVNEQWPSYWCELFANQGFVAVDLLRPLLWDEPGVDPWYLQNPIVYFRGTPPENLVAAAEKAVLKRIWKPAALVHPGLFNLAHDPVNRSIRKQVRDLLATLKSRLWRH